MHIYKAAAADIGPSGQALVINSLRVTGGSWSREAITACAFTELLPLISAPHGKKTLYHSRVHTDLALGTSPFIGFEKNMSLAASLLSTVPSYVPSPRRRSRGGETDCTSPPPSSDCRAGRRYRWHFSAGACAEIA